MKKITKYIVTLFLIILTVLTALSFISNKSYGAQAADTEKKYLSLYSSTGNASRNGRPTGFYTSGQNGGTHGTIPIIKIIEVNNTGDKTQQKADEKDEVIYCLNNGVGFGQGEGDEEAKDGLEYINYYDMRNAEDLMKNFNNYNIYDTNDLETNAEYNKLMWVLDNICIPEDDKSVEELFKKAGLNEQNKAELEKELEPKCGENNVEDVFKDIVECIQQTAIWNITGKKHPTTNITINVSEDNGVTYGTAIVNKYFQNEVANNPLSKLYNYLTSKPTENSSYEYEKAESTFTFDKDSAEVSCSDLGVKIGPYKITASNYSEFTASITDDGSNVDTNNAKIVDANNTAFKGDTIQAQIEDAISNKKEFYIQLLAGTSGNIKIDVSAKTKERKLELWTTNVNSVQTSQPVVIIDETSETKTGSDSKEVQEQKTQVKVTKQWVNNDNQDLKQIEITVKLKAQNDDTFQEKTHTLKDPNWTYTFENLPVYSPKGEKIKYHVEESNIPEGYTSSITRTRNGRGYYN